MITRDEIISIGHTVKPHGIHGEISAVIDPDVALESLRCVIFDIDGIYVPFFISSSRARGVEAVLLSIDGVESESGAASLCGLDIFALRSDISELIDENHADGGFFLGDLVDFDIVTADETVIGKIIDFDDSTANTLFIVETADGSVKYIPVAEQLIDSVDINKRIIYMTLPQGILEL